MGSEVSGISVVVPVGPHPAYLKYLPECLESIGSQHHSVYGDQIILLDDMAHLRNHTQETHLRFDMHGQSEWARYDNNEAAFNIDYYENDWLYGCAASWNRGVALAHNEWVILMGSDDKLLDGCLDACREIVSHKPDPLGFYNFTVQLDNGETHNVFNNAAMVSKALWRYTGGFPLAASVGAPDALLVSIMLRHMPEHLHQLKEGRPLYWVRTHPDQDTPRMAGLYNWEVIQIRDKETARFQPEPAWAQEKR